jgi:hypothetical protein
MPIRTVKQTSDRGSIKNIAKNNTEIFDCELKPQPFEIRLKKLFELYGNDKKMQPILGFITTDYISDKSALPLNVYRLRQIVADIKAKNSKQIDRLSYEISACMKNEISDSTVAYLTRRSRIKTASAKRPVFWRVNK